MSTSTDLLTADDLLNKPDDGFRYELVRGELRKIAPAGYEHGEVTMEFAWRLAQHVAANRLGKVCAAETGFLLSSNPDTVRAPDVAFVSQDRLPLGKKPAGFWPGPPDLAVETISPSDTYGEVEEKASAWLEAGTRMVLVMNPRNHTITVHRPGMQIVILKAADILDLDDLVPGFKVKVADIFE